MYLHFRLKCHYVHDASHLVLEHLMFFIVLELGS